MRLFVALVPGFYLLAVVTPLAVGGAKPAPGEIRRLTGHDGWVVAIAVSPDGRSLLSGGDDGTVRLWDVPTGRELRRFAKHPEPVFSVAFSPDGRRALSGCRDTSMRLWDVQTGKLLRRYIPTEGFCWQVAFAGGRRALAGGDEFITLWDLESGKEIRRLRGHKEFIWSVAASADGRWALTTGEDKTIRVWDVGTGREVHCLRGPTPSAATFSPDGQRILSGNADGTARLWDRKSGKELVTFRKRPGAVYAVAISPDGRRALTGCGRVKWDGKDTKRETFDCDIYLWETETGRQLARFQGHTGVVRGVAFSPDGRRAVSAAEDGTIRLWRLPQ